jgi:hypothetical protein
VARGVETIEATGVLDTFSPPRDIRIGPADAGPIHFTIKPQLADRFSDKGEFCRGELYLFFKDLDGYEVEIAFELPKLVYPKSTKITCLSCKALSYIVSRR